MTDTVIEREELLWQAGFLRKRKVRKVSISNQQKGDILGGIVFGGVYMVWRLVIALIKGSGDSEVPR